MKKALILVFALFIFVLVGCSNKNTTVTNVVTTTDSSITTTKIDETTNMTTTVDDNKFVFDEEEYMKGFSERRQYLIDYYNQYHVNIADGKVGFGMNAVRMLTYFETKNETYLTQASNNVDGCLRTCENNQNSCFFPYQFMTYYILFKDYLSNEQKTRYEALIKSYAGYAYNSATFNHTLFAAVGRYLAEQEFPGEIMVDYPGFKNNDPTDPTGEKAIRKVLEEYPTNGIFEYNSDTYYVCHLLALLSLAMCAKDEEIKTLATMELENGIFNMAPIYLNGHLCISQERTYMPYESQNYNAATNVLLWYYYGGDREYPTKKDLDFAEAETLAYFVYSDFMPNWISVMMATDRSEPYEHLEMHNVDYEGRCVYLQSYMTDTYSVFSGITGRQHVQSYNWAVRYVSEDPEYWSSFSIQHLNNVDDNRSLKFGSSDYMDVFQYKTTVIGVFDVPEGNQFPDIVLYEPANYKAIIDESYLGRLYLHYGSVIIAFQLSQPFVNTIEVTNYGDKVRCGAVTKGWFVCEVFDPREIDEETYEDQLYYVQSLSEGNFKRVKSDYTSDTKVEYTTVNGDTLSMKYGGYPQACDKTINGEVQQYKKRKYPLQMNPWVEQYLNEKVIVYRYKGYSYTFDFENKTTELKYEG